jgi:hypothetical protein
MIKLAFSLCLLLQSTFTFAAMQDGRWHPGIGDPTVFGWITVVVYLVSVWRCVVKAKSSKKFGGNYKFWLYLAVFLLFLSINKQLDLQSWFTEVLKDNAQAHGWYAQRRLFQVGFIIILGIAMLITLLVLRIFLANSWRHNKLTWVGIVLLSMFILMRAASFQHLDIFIGHPILGLRVNVMLEVGAILLIILGTFFDKKSVNLVSTNTHSIDTSYTEIMNAGDDVRCPKCGVQPLSNTVDGRVFKCRECGNKFTVNVVNA